MGNRFSDRRIRQCAGDLTSENAATVARAAYDLDDVSEILGEEGRRRLMRLADEPGVQLLPRLCAALERDETAVTSNVCGALGELAKSAAWRDKLLAEADALRLIPRLTAAVRQAHHPSQCNATWVFCRLAESPSWRARLLDASSVEDFVGPLVALVSSPHDHVVGNAALLVGRLLASAEWQPRLPALVATYDLLARIADNLAPADARSMGRAPWALMRLLRAGAAPDGAALPGLLARVHSALAGLRGDDTLRSLHRAALAVLLVQLTHLEGGRLDAESAARIREAHRIVPAESSFAQPTSISKAIASDVEAWCEALVPGLPHRGAVDVAVADGHAPDDGGAEEYRPPEFRPAAVPGPASSI